MKKHFSIIFIIISILFFVFGFLKSGEVNTALTEAFLPRNGAESINLNALANKSTNKLYVIFEDENKDNLSEVFEDFSSEVQSGENSLDVNGIIEVYKNYPENFLSKDFQNLIKNKDYKTLSEKSLELLYSPVGFYVSPPDKDPFLLSTNFVLANKKAFQNEIKNVDGKYYANLSLEVKEGDVGKIYELQKKYNLENSTKIYLTGTPIHSYLTAKKSKLEINIFCIISTIALLILCFYFFRTLKIAIPIFLSILFGFLCGYCASVFVFDAIHILTFVFGTSLIGISLDYSLHYFLERENTALKKSLTTSMLTTVLTFSLLYFSRIEILKQIAVFTSAGLFGTYLYVLFVLPLFKGFENFREIKPFNFSKKIKLTIFSIISLIVLVGVVRLEFNDDIKNLYNPSKNLLKAEQIRAKVFGLNTPEFILVKGSSVDEILLREEELTRDFEEQKIDYIALSKYISSSEKQRENQKLVSQLYKDYLSKHAGFLSLEAVKFLKSKPEKIYDISKFPLNSEFMLDENTSFVVLFNPKNLNLPTIKISDEFNKITKSVRVECLKLLPVIFAVLFVFLLLNFGFKKAVKIVLPSLAGALFSIGLISITGLPVNIFHILGLFLIIGFSLDYSIFRVNGGRNSSAAVLISAGSSAFSFMLLSLTSFKLISSLCFVLFVGILTSYILSLLLIEDSSC